MKRTLYSLLLLFIIFTAVSCSLNSLLPQLGKEASGKRLKAMQNSPNFKDGQFQNPVETNMDIGFKGYIEMISSRLFNSEENMQPDVPIPALEVTPEQLLANNDSTTIITWLGHSAFLVEIDGKRLLLDPMLGEVASPISFIGPKRFSALPMDLEDIPKIDAILISHDHYDHLDYGSIKDLESRTGHFFAPLGVGAHLEAWGVPANKITELDWWQEAELEGMKFVATPARHFSGRGLNDRMSTLWASWVIQGQHDKIFFSGDTGYFNGFKEIGDKYGPFDITLMECGQYNELWPNIHMMPEQTVQAHIDLRGKLMLPIHWGTFALAMHSWTDPVERMLAKARELNVEVTTPRIGEPVILNKRYPGRVWWRE